MTRTRSLAASTSPINRRSAFALSPRAHPNPAAVVPPCERPIGWGAVVVGPTLRAMYTWALCASTANLFAESRTILRHRPLGRSHPRLVRPRPTRR